MTDIDRFHAHLDGCARCARNPFDLCAEGHVLLLLCSGTPLPDVPRFGPKPATYAERRKWQDAQRAAGHDPECGREACVNPAAPAWVNAGTPLLYCRQCARLINTYNNGLCTLEAEL